MLPCLVLGFAALAHGWPRAFCLKAYPVLEETALCIYHCLLSIS